MTSPGRSRIVPNIPPSRASEVPTPEVDPDALAWWIHHQYDRCPPDHWVVASMMARPSGDWAEHVHSFTVADRATPDTIARLAKLAGRGDLYLTCCPRTERPPRGKRGGADTVGTLPGFWTDLDVFGPRHAADNLPPSEADALRLAYDVGVPPSLLNYSGGGIQAHYLLDKPVTITNTNRAEVAGLVAGWGRTMGTVGALHGWHVDEVPDLPRVLRPGGSLNMKTGDNPGAPLAPVPVEVGEGPDIPARYNLAELADLIVPAEPKRTAPNRPPDHRPPTPAGVPEGPADLLAGVGWWVLLEPLGWVFVRMKEIPPHGLAEQWRRPGATSTHSGNFWEHYGTIHSDNAGTSRTHVALSKFTIYAELWHGGDTRAAGKAIYSDAANRWGVAS